MQKNIKDLKLEVMMSITHSDQYYENSIKSDGKFKIENLTHTELSFIKASMLSDEADAIIHIWRTTVEDDIDKKLTYLTDKIKISNMLINHKQILLDYIYEFAALYGQYYHSGDADSILNKVNEKLELPEEFLKRFQFN